jgi:hypothetical protein
VGVGRRWTVLGDHEQRIWDDIGRFYAEEAEEPVRAALPTTQRRRGSREQGEAPAVVVAGGWIAVVSIVFGALAAGVAIGIATALGWLLWRCWPYLSDEARLFPPPGSRGVRAGGRAHRLPEEP